MTTNETGKLYQLVGKLLEPDASNFSSIHFLAQSEELLILSTQDLAALISDALAFRRGARR